MIAARIVAGDLAGARVFMTGGTGFLGRAVTGALLAANREHDLGLSLTLLSRDAARFARACPEFAAAPEVDVCEGDVRSFIGSSASYTHVIHAATDSSADADARPLELIDTIVSGTARVLAFARRCGARRFLYVSSGAVYGPQPLTLDRIPETYGGAPPTDDPRSNYGQAKRLAEQLCTAHSGDGGRPARVARCFSFAGPHLPTDGHFAIGNFIADAVAGRVIRVAGDGTPVRTYLDVDDAAVWLLRLLCADTASRIYNVGSDEPITVGALAARVAALIPGARGVRIDGAPAPPGPRHRYVPDVTRARCDLSLDVWTNLDTTIRRTAASLAVVPT